MGCSVPSTTAESMCPTTTTTTSTATLSTFIPTNLPASISSGPLSTSNAQPAPKAQTQMPPLKSQINCCPTPTPTSPPHSEWSSDMGLDGAKQKERERISEIKKIQNKKIAEEEKRRKAIKGILPCAPDW